MQTPAHMKSKEQSAQADAGAQPVKSYAVGDVGERERRRLEYPDVDGSVLGPVQESEVSSYS